MAVLHIDKSNAACNSKRLYTPDLEFTLPQENDPLHLLAQKCGLQYQTILSLQPLLPLNGKLELLDISGSNEQ